MTRSHSWRLLRLLAVSAVLVLTAQIFVCRIALRKRPREAALPLPEDVHRILAPETYEYIINQPDICKERSPFLVFMVPVSPAEAEAREAVRKTWGAPNPNTLTLFYTGLPKGPRVGLFQEKMEEESKAHADIIQMNFQDSYQNLTIKTMMMMNWLATYCPSASYAMKVDADIFVNVFYLVNLLKSAPERGFITGSVIRDGAPRRDRNSKWYLSEELYPEDSFPWYVSGAGYVFSLDLAAKISWGSRFVRMIPLEDVYVGLCLRVVGIKPVYSRSLLTFRNLFEIRNLKYDRCTFARLVIVNQFKPSELVRIWQDFSSGHDNC